MGIGATCGLVVSLGECSTAQLSTGDGLDQALGEPRVTVFVGAGGWGSFVFGRRVVKDSLDRGSVLDWVGQSHAICRDCLCRLLNRRWWLVPRARKNTNNERLATHTISMGV
jgi:hypothetical protein